MEISSPLILEISSDEEAGFGEPRNGGSGYGVGGGGFGDGEDYAWLSKLLVEVGGNKDDDSDDVVVVSEVFGNPSKKSRIEPLKPSTEVVCDVGGDDDCVVLDGDPDKPLAVVNAKADDCDDDSDDVEIVGEKGEVACRDFPHPRHLCAKFLFASTPHEAHCGQCHCYVCDSLAPCPLWGTGISSIDHCHASDKEEYWKAERKRIKKGDKPVPVTPSISHTPVLEALMTSQALAPRQLNSLPQNQGLSPVTIHPCRMSSIVRPNAVNQGRTLPSGGLVPRFRSRPQAVSLESHPACNNNVALGGKSHNTGSRSAYTCTPRAVFKQPGIIGASPNNRHVYASQLSRGPSLKRCRAYPSPVMTGSHGSNQLNAGNRAAHVVLPQPPRSMNVGCANYAPSQRQIHSRPYSSCLSRAPVQDGSQTSSHSYLDNNFVSAVPFQPHLAPQPSVENFENMILSQHNVVFQPNNPVPSQPVGSYQLDAGTGFGDQLHSSSSIISNPTVANDFENQPSEPQAHENHTSLLIDVQNCSQQEDHTQNGVDVSRTDFGFSWDSPSHGNLQVHAEVSQCQSAAAADNSQLETIREEDHHQSIGPIDNFERQSVVAADNSTPINDTFCQFPESTKTDSLDFHFDSWMFENQTLPGALDPVSPVWNVFSPEPASVDTGTLFDI